MGRNVRLILRALPVVVWGIILLRSLIEGVSWIPDWFIYFMIAFLALETGIDFIKALYDHLADEQARAEKEFWS